MKFPPIELRSLHHRDQIGPWLDNRGLNGVGFEIGTLFGGYAAKILEGWTVGHLYCVDTWQNQPQDKYHDGANLLNMETVYQQALNGVGKNPRCQLVRAMSTDAAMAIKDESLDFAYLDANHAVDAIRADIRAWFPKVKVGGLFCGHDFYIRYDNDTNSDAQTAVMEFALQVGEFPQCTWCNSWWFVKTEGMKKRYEHAICA